MTNSKNTPARKMQEPHAADAASSLYGTRRGKKRIDALNTYLGNSHIRLPEFGCFVALSPDREAIFNCPMLIDDSPDLDDDGHMNWGEVTAPEPEFVEKINELYGTSFEYEKFAGR